MSATESSARPSSVFANAYALNAFGNAPRAEEGADFVEHYARYARESAELLHQISMKAPQLASVLEQLNEGSLAQRIALADDEAKASAPQRRTRLREKAGHALAGVASLLQGCRALLQMKMIKNNRQA
ncbi:hypothetical protein [Herbaspirillum sp. C7C8]|jgi:hypothetical protein|uniref:hypothetical protein n=1 Tax=Herbaspirillum sp. C7C8 TaxID=2736665 RepID=UPI001F51EEBF|nr:hypothetical protein [Herbaspirillum sp. C7C8]MCI1005881.1 hypothetical protein [Herbaspirillum sp. C7C8]